MVLRDRYGATPVAPPDATAPPGARSHCGATRCHSNATRHPMPRGGATRCHKNATDGAHVAPPVANHQWRIAWKNNALGGFRGAHVVPVVAPQMGAMWSHCGATLRRRAAPYVALQMVPPRPTTHHHREGSPGSRPQPSTSNPQRYHRPPPANGSTTRPPPRGDCWLLAINPVPPCSANRSEFHCEAWVPTEQRAG